MNTNLELAASMWSQFLSSDEKLTCLLLMGSVAWLLVLLLSKGNKIFVTPEKALNFDSFSKIQAMLEVVAQPKWFNFMRR